MSAPVIAPVDPLRPVRGGRYDDGVVLVVAAVGPAGVRASEQADGRILVRHCLTTVDDDLAELLAAALAPLTDDPDVFARAFVGVVVTGVGEPIVAWEQFYRASLHRLTDATRTGYVEVYRHALELLPRTSVLDLGAGFGFLALHLAGLGVQVIAADSSRPTARMLATMRTRLRLPVQVLASNDDGRVPLADDHVDAVALLHVLEHVDSMTATALVSEALRVARHRVVVAVPFEDEPTQLFGHLRRFDLDSLTALGRTALGRTALGSVATTGWTVAAHEHHGGWLVFDRPGPHPTATADGSLLREGDRR